MPIKETSMQNQIYKVQLKDLKRILGSLSNILNSSAAICPGPTVCPSPKQHQSVCACAPASTKLHEAKLNSTDRKNILAIKK